MHDFDPDYWLDYIEKTEPVPIPEEGPIGEHWERNNVDEDNTTCWTQYSTPLTMELNLNLLDPAQRALLSSQLDEIIPRTCD